MRKALSLLLGNLLVFLALLLVVELGGQLYATLHPAYQGLPMQPDRAIGWKLTPGLRWISTGNHWYARDFSVPVAANSAGFRDRERSLAKPAGARRVAVLGDSFVQAVQVRLEKTATQLLEQRLGAEVLNFGISNHGIGQYLLTYETYASRYRPDRVVIFTGGFHMRRTVARFEGSLVDPRRPRLWIRPTFSLDEDQLVREPARDYDKFVAAQNQAIERVFGGQRMRRAPRGLFLAPLAAALGRLVGIGDPIEAWRPIPERTLEINLRVIGELASAVSAAGARLYVADASSYFEAGDAPVAERLKRLCAERDLVYIPLAERLLQANRAGEATRWRHDGHFNDAGNRIFAEAMAEALPH